MALTKCFECGREISTHAASCPGCGAPRHEPDSLDSNSLSALPRDSERDLYSDADIAVTTSRLVVASETYAIRNITSAAVVTNTPPTEGTSRLGCGGLMLLFGVWMAAEASSAEEESTAFSLVVFGAGLVAWGVYKYSRKPKVTYTVVLTTAAGQKAAFTSGDRDRMARVAKAVADAIAAR